eukprot:gene8047-5600_t
MVHGENKCTLVHVAVEGMLVKKIEKKREEEAVRTNQSNSSLFLPLFFGLFGVVERNSHYLFIIELIMSIKPKKKKTKKKRKRRERVREKDIHRHRRPQLEFHFSAAPNDEKRTF